MFGSFRRCCVPKCGLTRADTVLHAFPDPVKEDKRFAAWLNAVGSSLSSLSHDFIFKNRKICHIHFEEKYFNLNRRLNYEAVPTLLMPGFQERVMRDITNLESGCGNLEPVASTSNVSEPVVASTYTEASPTVIPEQLIPIEPATVKQSLKGKIRGTKYMDEKAVLEKMLKKMTKKKENYATRLKKALKLSENATFQNSLKKFTSLAAIFLTLQFREVNKKKMGRRFTEQEKIMALSLYKQGPRCYRFMCKAFVLPSPLTLSRLISRANLRAGINEKLFKVMKKKIKNLTADDKLCILLFDEIAITPHFEYNRRKDAILGFVTDGKNRQNKIADHALVFIIRGVLRNYKQPVAYTLVSGTKKEELAMLIKDVIRKLHTVGLRVVATVCDQVAPNVSCINHLIGETKANYLRENKELKRNIFEVDGKEVIPLYDPPHLIKGIRNNLLDKDLKCSIDGVPKTAKWKHIIELYKEDPSYSGIRLLKNLTNNHVYPEKCKMKVKYATQVFSSKVASTMGYLAKKKILCQESQQTADILLFFDDLFDSFNGSKENSKKRSGKPLLGALTPKSIHNVVWTKAKRVLSTMKFVKNGEEKLIPSVSNWLHTVNNAEYLRDVLFNKYNLKSIWMRHFNQDPLENFFGSIRSHGCRNVSPTPEGFEIAFASLLLNNLSGTHSPGSNCEQDLCTSMFESMQSLFKKSEISNTSLIDLDYMQNDIFVDFEIKKNDIRILAQLEYVTGYLLRQTKKHVFQSCISCKNDFYNIEKDNEYLKAREYNKNKQYLQYPTHHLVQMFSKVQDILMWVLKNHSKVENIRNFAKTILYVEININFITCETHKKKCVEFLFDFACRFFICNWCKDVNNILKSCSRETVSEDIVKKLALEYVQKRKKVKN